MRVASYTQITQNNKFAVSFQYLKENVNDEVDFFPAVEHQRFVQPDTVILDACGQACPYYSK